MIGQTNKQTNRDYCFSDAPCLPKWRLLR